MSRPRPLFVMSSKRSGSTLTANLLNTHPNVFVSHEADTAWILYQSRYGRPARYEPHPLDSRMMMTSTVRRCRRILGALGTSPASAEIVEAFYAIQSRVLEDWSWKRSPLRGRFRVRHIVPQTGKNITPRRLWKALRKAPDRPPKRELAWIGDKKHAQHLDPEVRSFLDAHFPEARYVHLIRDPRSVVASTMEAEQAWHVAPEYFEGDAAQILEQWARHEEWVLAAKERGHTPILTIRFEDLFADPSAAMTEILAFLDLEMTDDVTSRIPLLVHPRDPNEKHAGFVLPEVPRAKRVMEHYGYR